MKPVCTFQMGTIVEGNVPCHLARPSRRAGLKIPQAFVNCLAQLVAWRALSRLGEPKSTGMLQRCAVPATSLRDLAGCSSEHLGCAVLAQEVQARIGAEACRPSTLDPGP
jgi:hypothetical protein